MSKAALKGPVKALRGARVVQRPREWLSAEAIEVFFRHAEVLSEGAIHEVKGGDSSYMGSTMISVDMGHLASRWRGPLDGRARDLLLRLLEGSVRVRLRASRIARAEAARRVTDRPLGTTSIDTCFRIDGDYLHVDIDLEVPLGVFSALEKVP